MDSQKNEWLTITDACEYLRVSKRTAYRWMDAGNLPYYFIGAGAVPRRIRRKDLEDILIEVESAD